MAAPKEAQPAKKQKKQKKAKGEKLTLNYDCQASAEMMVKIFTLKEEAFLKAVFYGQIQKKGDTFIIGDNQSFTFKVLKQEVTQINDDEDEPRHQHRLETLWHRKEWNDDEWSTVDLVFTDDEEMDKKCELELTQKGIPTNDKHGNADQLTLIKQFWKQTIFKGLTQFGNIGCKEKD
mmetsp:Transcript_1260/g.1922  ORF Transcript_1260/g.1922 Transcript_1260/m.1922 type:complete len:177 (+) Transcript_1260:52-582(+)